MENTPAEPALGRGYLLLTRGAPWLLLLIVVGCYVMSFRARGTPDIDEYWTPWTTSIRDHGLKEGYPAARSDYPPVCFLMLGAMDHIAERWHFDHFRTLKVTLGIFAVLGGAAFWWWGRNLWQTVGLLFAILVNSMAEGYLDVLYLPVLLLALLSLERRGFVRAGFLMALAIGIKWQPIMLLPFFLLFAVKAVRPEAWWRGLAGVAAGAAPVVLSCLVIFSPSAIADSFWRALSHTALSFQALNAPWILQLFLYKAAKLSAVPYYATPLPGSAPLIGKGIFFLVYGFFAATYWRKGKSFADFLWYGCAGLFTYYAVNIGVHENHLFVAMVLAFALFCVRSPLTFPMAALLGVMTTINLVLFYGWDGSAQPPVGNPFFDTASVIFSVANVGLILLCLAYAWLQPKDGASAR